MATEPENKASVLIVDDEPFFRQVIADILSADGYDSIEAASGADVAILLGRNRIGLVLTDLEMPDVSGLEVLRKVKSLKPEVPVVIISGHEDFYAARGVLSGGAMDYLVKPFADEELLAVVERGLGQYHSNLEEKQNQEAAERLLADLVLLREVGETASSEADLEVLVDKIVGKVVDAVQVKTASLMLPAKDGNLRIRASRGLPEGVREKAIIKPGEGVSGHVFETGEPVLLTDIDKDGRFAPSGGSGQYTTSSALSLPLKGRDQVIGVLNVNNKLDGESFSANDEATLASIAHQATLAIENFSLISELRNKAKELEALSAARSRLVCNLSHELKTPLTTVLGFADLLQSHRSQFSEKELSEYLHKISESSLHMEKLISGMLLLFSIDSGSASWANEPISVADVIQTAVNFYREQIDSRRIKLDMQIDEALPELTGDVEKFQLLIEALVDNAIKFNEDSGWLHVQAVSMFENNEPYIYIRLENAGAHIPVGATEEIFAQYSQLGEINTAKPEGVGIGLALCRIIVEKMGGSIFLEDTGGTGTAFGLLLPVSAAPEGKENE